VATHRHKREPHPRRFARLVGGRALSVAAGAAVTATVAVVGVGVISAGPGSGTLVASHAPAAGLPPAGQPARQTPLSRTFHRAGPRTPAATADRATSLAVADAATHRWTTTALDLWSSAAAGARKVGEVPAGHPVLVTGRSAGGRVELAVHGRSRWVTAGYLSDRPPALATPAATAPATPPATGLSMAPCPDPSVEYRLTPGAVYVYRSVCHAFPQITTYGGWDDHGEHVTGKALDIMTGDVALGNEIAAFLQQHASELHIYDILWQQHIWTPVRAGEGWRLFADRGSPTANHMDHVHVSVY
jgi:hypothetical protein